MGIELTPERLAHYRRGALQRLAREQHDIARRRDAAWQMARRAAELLRQDFGASRVVAFGSLAHGAWFGERSDIDLAVEGIAPEAFWRAWCALDRLGTDFEFDLVPFETASPRLKAGLDREGVAL